MRKNDFLFGFFSQAMPARKPPRVFKIMRGGSSIALPLIKFLFQDVRWYLVLELTHSLPSARGLITGWPAINLKNKKGRVRISPLWRCGRVAEGAPLLREYRVCSPIEGSNPSVSATLGLPYARYLSVKLAFAFGWDMRSLLRKEFL